MMDQPPAAFTPPTHVIVRRLTMHDRNEVVSVLCDAFADYPVMRYVLGEGHSEDLDREDLDKQDLARLVGFYADKRLLHGWPVWGVEVDGALEAAILVTPPSASADSSITAQLESVLAYEIGQARYKRMLAFEEASDLGEPADPHHFVGMLGVRRRSQGKGYAALLIEEVKQAAVQEGLHGVWLTTEDTSNLPFYAHLGFEVVRHTEVASAELETWALQWSYGPPPPRSAPGERGSR